MNRAASLVLVASLAVVCAACNKREATDKTAAVASASAAPRASSPPPPSEPAVDVSGKWDCSWAAPTVSGTETWNMFQDGESVRATFTGRDPGGGYAGSMTGTFKNRQLELSYKYTEGITGTISAKVSANGKAIDGEETRATSKVISHYGCNRP
jgi:hypothetical protein